MTIKPNEAWGRTVPRPSDLVTVPDDASLAAHLSLLAAEAPPVTVAGGDVLRTLGGGSGAHSATLLELPIDLVEVSLDGADPLVAVAHVVIRSTLARGSWLAGPIVLVMNAEFVGDWDVAPRGHPNDGRVEVFEAAAAMSVRHRLAAPRRMRSAQHVPHPAITTRSVRAASWNFERPMTIRVDGRPVGVAQSVDVKVHADAAVMYA